MESGGKAESQRNFTCLVSLHQYSSSPLATPLQWIGSIATKPVTIGLLWTVALGYFGLILSAMPHDANEFDFSHYYASALVLRQGHNPYFTNLTPIAMKFNLQLGEITQGTYPPTFLLFFEPLTLLRAAIAYWVWMTITIAALSIALFFLLGPSSGLKKETALSAAALALIFLPLKEHFHFAQCQILILLMLVEMARLVERGRAAWAGLLLAAAALLRVFPIIILGYFIARGRQREVLYTACALTIGGLLTIALVGLHSSLGFVAAVRFVTSPRWLEAPKNVAMTAFIMRQFQWFKGTPTLAVQISRQAVTWAARLAILVLTFRATMKGESDKFDTDWRNLSLWIAAMILLSPTAWTHYLVMLLFPYAAMVVSASHGRVSSRAAMMMILSYALINSLLVFTLIEYLHVRVPNPFQPPSGFIVLAMANICAFSSVLAAWIACYWWRVDEQIALRMSRTRLTAA